MNKLILQTLGTFVMGVLVLGLLLFLPAGTLNYWQAWVFIVVFMISVNTVGVYLSVKDPALLERRKRYGPAAEQSPAQKIIISIAILANLGFLVFCALDHRFGWSRMPAICVSSGRRVGGIGTLHRPTGVQGKQLWLFKYPGGNRTNSHLDRSLLFGAASHVRWSSCHGHGCAPGARLVVGIDNSGYDDTWAGVENPG